MYIKVLLRCLGFIILCHATNNLSRQARPIHDFCKDTGCCCWGWKFVGKCKRSSSYAVNSCPRTCGFCPNPPTAPPATVSLSHSVAPTTPVASSTAEPRPVSPPNPVRPACTPLKLPISKQQYIDQRLTGHVAVQEGAISETQCEDYCLRFPSCIAYNYYYRDAARDGRKDCELLEKIEGILPVNGVLFRFFERGRAQKILLGHCDAMR